MASSITPFKSKRDLVYDYLRTEILQGTFAPGARIVIDEVASQLGVSQIPIREALQQLQSEGFVSIEPHVGPRVTEIHASHICEIFELLESLEVISSRAACARMDDDAFIAMEAMLRQMDAIVADAEAWSPKNVDLHYFICDQADMHLVKTLISTVLNQWDRLRCYYLNDVFLDHIPAAQREHWELFEALRQRDADLVEQIIRRHNRAALAAYVGHLKVSGQVAEDFAVLHAPSAKILK